MARPLQSLILYYSELDKGLHFTTLTSKWRYKLVAKAQIISGRKRREPMPNSQQQGLSFTECATKVGLREVGLREGAQAGDPCSFTILHERTS